MGPQSQSKMPSDAELIKAGAPTGSEEIQTHINYLKKAIAKNDLKLFEKYGWGELGKLLIDHNFSDGEKDHMLEQIRLMLKLWGNGLMGKERVASIAKKCINAGDALSNIGDDKYLIGGAVKETNPVVLWVRAYREENSDELGGAKKPAEKSEGGRAQSEGMNAGKEDGAVITPAAEKTGAETGAEPRKFALGLSFDSEGVLRQTPKKKLRDDFWNPDMLKAEEAKAGDERDDLPGGNRPFAQEQKKAARVEKGMRPIKIEEQETKEADVKKGGDAKATQLAAASPGTLAGKTTTSPLDELKKKREALVVEIYKDRGMAYLDKLGDPTHTDADLRNIGLSEDEQLEIYSILATGERTIKPKETAPAAKADIKGGKQAQQLPKDKKESKEAKEPEFAFLGALDKMDLGGSVGKTEIMGGAVGCAQFISTGKSDFVFDEDKAPKAVDAHWKNFKAFCKEQWNAAEPAEKETIAQRTAQLIGEDGIANLMAKELFAYYIAFVETNTEVSLSQLLGKLQGLNLER